MTAFLPKKYQSEVLASVTAYFEACHEFGNPATAFTVVTERLWQQASAYRALGAGFDIDMPYFCLRVPTGGGKTWLAAKCAALINTHLLRSERSVLLWLVPSKAIREQTIKGLRDRSHPLHAALREAGPVAVLDLDEAKSLTRATLDTATVIIVATRQAFQVEDEECRKVYQSSGALMHHFDGLDSTQREALLRDEGDGTAPYSLANVLRLRRPFVVIDEAHNSRTPLGFDMLARLKPAGVMELTATPDTERVPSNVLHSVSAAELKAEQMIKLPVLLQTEPDWRQCLGDAVARRNALQAIADAERLQGGAPYLRPVVLIQAEPRRAGVETLDVERVRNELVANQGIATDEVVIATGEERGLDAIDAAYALGIADPLCPVKYLVTQRALAEGWDCPSAYILVSMAALHSATAVEQLIGRVLRQPQARQRSDAALNRSYAFVVSAHFAQTAAALRERLVSGAGFERRAARDFVAAALPQQRPFDLEGAAHGAMKAPIAVALAATADLKQYPKALRDKLDWNAQTGTLTIKAPLEPADESALLQAACASGADLAEQALVAQAAEASRTSAVEFFQTPAERGEVFAVPQLGLRIQGELQLFDEPEALDYPWNLSLYAAAPLAADLAALGLAMHASEGGELDVNAASGLMVTRFLPELQRDLGLAYRPEHWDEVQLAAWLCRNLPDQGTTHQHKLVFVLGWLSALLRQPRMDLGRANLQKYLIRQQLERQIRALRAQASAQAVQQALFGDGRETRVAVSPELLFEYHPDAYAPTRDDEGQYGRFEFRRHYFSRIGAFDSGDEFECACWLDMQAQRGRLRFWVRNLVRREGCSFFLQKAGGRFYPDFVALLPDGTALVVEVKGGQGWTDAADDRAIGGLWAELSGGRCRFVMVRDRQWQVIDSQLTAASPAR